MTKGMFFEISFQAIQPGLVGTLLSGFDVRRSQSYLNKVFHAFKKYFFLRIEVFEQKFVNVLPFLEFYAEFIKYII